jgi:ferredoxin
VPIELLTAKGRLVVDPATLQPDDPERPTLLDAVRAAGLPLAQSCRGEGICRSCAVDIEAGGDALLPLSRLEVRFGFTADRRLACQAPIPGPGVALRVHHPSWGRPAPPPDAPIPASDGTLDP